MKNLFVAVMALSMAFVTVSVAADETTLSLNAGASLKVKQDRLAVSLSIREEGQSVEEVQAEINRRMEAAIKRADKVKSVSVTTGNYRVYYQNYNRMDKKPEDGAVGRWVGTQTLTLDSGDFEAVKSLAGKLQQSGLAMNHMNFYVSAALQEATKDKLIPMAVETLKKKAKLYQMALGGDVLILKSLQVQGMHRMIQEAAPMMMAKSGFEADQASPVVAGPDEQEISLSLEGKFDLSPIIIE